MAFCKNCGAQLDENEKFCHACGSAVAAENGVQDTVDAVKEKFNAINDTPDTTAEYDQSDIQPNRGIAWLAYCSLLFLVPLLARKDSKFCRFHVNQGIVLFIAEVACTILNNVFDRIGGVIGFILNLPVLAVSIIGLVLAIKGIVNAAKGRVKELPIIGGIKILK